MDQTIAHTHKRVNYAWFKVGLHQARIGESKRDGGHVADTFNKFVQLSNFRLSTPEWPWRKQQFLNTHHLNQVKLKKVQIFWLSLSCLMITWMLILVFWFVSFDEVEIYLNCKTSLATIWKQFSFVYLTGFSNFIFQNVKLWIPISQNCSMHSAHTHTQLFAWKSLCRHPNNVSHSFQC